MRRAACMLIGLGCAALAGAGGAHGADAPVAAREGADATSRPGLLLADDAARPEVTVRWRAGGRAVERTGVYPFGAPVGGDRFDQSNLLGFVALGGVRLEMGAGHPQGAILRVGLVKADERRGLFPGIDPGSAVEIEVRGARFNQPVRARAGTGLVRLRYSLKDMEACALPDTAAAQYLTARPGDTLGGMLRPGENASPGALAGGPGEGRLDASVDADGSVRLHAVIPYALLRHLQDPWASDLPGTFFEPVIVQAEVEVVPVGVPEDGAAGTNPGSPAPGASPVPPPSGAG